MSASDAAAASTGPCQGRTATCTSAINLVLGARQTNMDRVAKGLSSMPFAEAVAAGIVPNPVPVIAPVLAPIVDLMSPPRSPLPSTLPAPSNLSGSVSRTVDDLPFATLVRDGKTPLEEDGLPSLPIAVDQSFEEEPLPPLPPSPPSPKPKEVPTTTAEAAAILSLDSIFDPVVSHSLFSASSSSDGVCSDGRII